MLHLRVRDRAVLEARHMFELLRLASALDPSASAPLLVVCGPQVSVQEDAMRVLRRGCKLPGRCMAILTSDLEFRLTTEVFRKAYAPPFPLKAFSMKEDAWRWLRERMQLKALETQQMPCS